MALAAGLAAAPAFAAATVPNPPSMMNCSAVAMGKAEAPEVPDSCAPPRTQTG